MIYVLVWKKSHYMGLVAFNYTSAPVSTDLLTNTLSDVLNEISDCINVYQA